MRWRDLLIPAIFVPILLLMLVQAFSLPIPGIVVPNKVTTGDTNNTHPVADSNEIQGGPMQFTYSSELRGIPEARKRKGILVYVSENDTYYMAYSTHGHYWRKWVSDGGTIGPQGPPGPPGQRGYSGARGQKGDKGDRGYDGRYAGMLTCTILDGTRTVTYYDGVNPQPFLLAPLYYYMYLDGQLVTPVYLDWYIPATGSQLKYPPIQPDGMQAHMQYFAFRVYSTYSTTRPNNYARVQGAYSSPKPPYGRRYCTATANISVVNQVPGPQGIPGPPATVTKTAVATAFETTASDETLVLQSQTGSAAQLEIREPGQNTVFWMDGLGNMYFKQANGDTMVKVLAGGSILLFRANSKRVEILNNATITTYHSDGTTPAMQIYSTGRGPWEPPAGNPGVDGYCWKSTAAGVRSWGSCGTGSGVAGSNKQFQYNNNGAFAGTAYARYTTGGTVLSGTLVIR